MNTFNAIVTNNKTIEVTSNTYWSCKAEGNYKLSQYDGSGNATINIIIPEDVITAEGVIYFTYGDERCEFPQISVLFNNYCYIKTIPSYTVCNFDETTQEKDIYLMYEEENEILNISVFCNGDWTVQGAKNCAYLIRKNELMIISGEKSGELYIVPMLCGNNIIKVKLIKNGNMDS